MKIHFSHILVEHKYQAEDVQKKLVSGEATFEELARQYSQCSSAPQGGDLGLVQISRLDADFVEAGEKLAPGAVSPVVRTRFGYHLIKRHT